MNIATTAGVEAMLKATPGAVKVVLGGVTTWGHEEFVDELVDVGGGTAEVVGRARSVVVATGALTITKGATPTVDGTSRTIRDFRAEEDGAITRLVLTG